MAFRKDRDKTNKSEKIEGKKSPLHRASLVEKETRDKTIKANFTGEQVFSNDKEAIDLYGKRRFGEMQEGKVYYSNAEALYLVEKKKLELYEGRKKLAFDKFISLLKKKDDRIQTKYSVFKDMRNRGYIVKTALKFGAEFRVYDKGISPGEDHAKWILYPVNENSGFTWHDFSAKNRVAHSTKKNLLIGIVDEEGDVTYYQVSWIKP